MTARWYLEQLAQDAILRHDLFANASRLPSAARLTELCLEFKQALFICEDTVAAGDGNGGTRSPTLCAMT